MYIFRINFTVFDLSQITFPDEIMLIVDEGLVKEFTILGFSTFLFQIKRFRVELFLFLWILWILLDWFAIWNNLIFEEEIRLALFVDIVTQRYIDGGKAVKLLKLIVFFPYPTHLTILTFILLWTDGFLHVGTSAFGFR